MFQVGSTSELNVKSIAPARRDRIDIARDLIELKAHLKVYLLIIIGTNADEFDSRRKSQAITTISREMKEIYSVARSAHMELEPESWQRSSHGQRIAHRKALSFIGFLDLPGRERAPSP